MKLKRNVMIFWELFLLIIQTIITLIILSVVIPFVIVKVIMEEIYIYGKVGINNLKQTAFIRRFTHKKVDN